MPVWLLTLAYVLVALGNSSTQTAASDVILGAAPPDRVGAVAAMKPASGMTGYTLGPTIFVLLLNVFFGRLWLEEAEARGLTDQQAQRALDVVVQAATGSNPVVPYDPYLVQQGVSVARADYSTAVMITMLIITVAPLVVAALAYFLIPRGSEQTPQEASTGDRQAG
jgi:hypothetical protein